MFDRQTTFVICLALLALFIVIFIEIYNANSRQYQDAEIVVTAGDTLWNIAEEHCPNQDPRKTIDLIKQKNDIQGHIQPGQILVVPYEVNMITAYTNTEEVRWSE